MKCFSSYYFCLYYSLFHAIYSSIFLDADSNIDKLLSVTHRNIINIFISAFGNSKADIMTKDIADLFVDLKYRREYYSYAAYRRTKAADKPAFRTAHEADLLLHEAAKRAFDAQGVKKLPTVKVLQAEYTELLTKKKAAYEDYKRLRKENQELQAVKSNVDTLLRIEEEPQEKKQEQHR